MTESSRVTTGDLRSFLEDLESRPVHLEGLGQARLYLGQGDAALEVVVVDVPHPPREQVRTAWRKRQKDRPAPLLVVVQEGQGVRIHGPTGEEERWTSASLADAEALCRAALKEPNRHAALRLLSTALPDLASPTPGLRNQGLFATHHLREGLPKDAGWGRACEKAHPLMGLRDKELIGALGFQIRPLEGPASVLVTAGGAQVAVAIFLDQRESAEIASDRFGGFSPVMYALHQADRTQVKYVVVSTGAGLRLYSTQPGAGVGHRGRTETYAEVRLDLLRREQAGYLWMLFSAEALSAGGSAERALDDSRRYATRLGERLRDRIYDKVMPKLALAILKAQGRSRPKPQDLDRAYKMSLTLLFRLLFVAYAEDLDLLPYRTNEAYRRRAFKTRINEASVPWREVDLIFQAVARGKRDWGIPEYDGGLFSSDPKVSETGAALANLELPDDLFTEAFLDLLLGEGPDGRGPVDFRSLGVRDFGTIYEGLLENELAVAETDLAVGKEGVYKEAGKSDKVVVRSGQIYLRNRSGKRKATGSYYTKRFAVEHLLDRALEPALDEHLKRLDGMGDEEASKAFFDFRVADIAMGSGHFLVAAIDRIERKLSSWLAGRPLKGVREELERLRKSALEALGPAGEGIDIEDGQLLRRQIARRCIYGVDLNEMAVELGRLSVWVHTFVPGLPLSVLDHNIVTGNSLAGIASLEEAREVLQAGGLALFLPQVEKMLSEACRPLVELSALSESNAAEIKKARAAIEEARKAVAPAEALFDILTASRLDKELARKAQSGSLELRTLCGSPERARALEILRPIKTFHFPLAFPEVFMRGRPGFDVILGNPPWEKAKLEEDGFWMRYHPGLQGLPQREREKIIARLRRENPDLIEIYEEEKALAEALRRLLTGGQFPGMGTGDPDTYKAFAWRFWQLAARDGGRIGVVLPRSAFCGAGAGEWRKRLLAEGRVEDLTFLLNRDGWVFDDAEPRYTIALVSISSRKPEESIPLRGPFNSEEEYLEGLKREPVRLSLDAVKTASDTMALPLLPSESSLEIWLQMRKAPRLDTDDRKSWFAKPYRELDATTEKGVMKFSRERPKGHWPVFKGESFDIWVNDRGPEYYYAWGDPGKVTAYLQGKRKSSFERKGLKSTYAGFSREWVMNPRTLACLHPRIAFRDVTNRTNQRTVIAALVPHRVFLTNAAPYLLWPRGDEKDQAFLLGVVCSIPLDWYARTLVETHVNFHVLNPFPIPRPGRSDPRWKRVVALAGRLAAQDRRLSEWARKVGVDCGPLNEGDREEMIAELDAVVARLYGLTEAQVRHIFETFHEGWAYQERLERVLKYFQKA